jgi:hypothetical protein
MGADSPWYAREVVWPKKWQGFSLPTGGGWVTARENLWNLLIIIRSRRLKVRLGINSATRLDPVKGVT